MDPKHRIARRDRLRARAVTTTVVATVVAAPVFALWAAYRGTPVGEAQDGRSASAREDGGPVDLDGEGAGVGYENTGNASTRPGPRFGKDGKADVSVEVAGVPGAGRAGAAALGVTAGHSGDTTLITLTATGSEPVRWSVSTGASWLYPSRTSGTLAPGESVTVKVYVDQLREPSGPWSAAVAVSPAGAVVTIDGYGTAPGPRPGHPGGPGTAHPGTPGDPPPSTHPDPTPPEPTPSDPPPGPGEQESPSPDPEPTPGGTAPADPPGSTPVSADGGGPAPS
ncbi:alanine-rich protein [Streptomyces viridosporus ATCC 14672]|uniref:Alanine-rich protein n=1 Tax=Streptomyces viridosporus (strain ATCC 14672 / DSM 40746 / JCM 4963 / KCTC 9882 / NRRL B-12104 / FH 1290) TaxID=566461 RepID=D6A6D2_STRV1|nr:alanine-rich protein [Streptomyces viridosporus ATCC 14672]